MKICTSCGESKPHSAFHANKAKPDGCQSQCKVCRKNGNAAYYQRTKHAQREKRRSNKRRMHQRNQAIVLDALSAGCVDCGVGDVRVLEFDHLRDKEFGIARAIRYSGERRLRAEIAKCEVVCANCHRIRTYSRSGSWRLEVESSMPL